MLPDKLCKEMNGHWWVQKTSATALDNGNCRIDNERCMLDDGEQVCTIVIAVHNSKAADGIAKQWQ